MIRTSTHFKQISQKSSEVKDVYWLYATRLTGTYPPDSANSGKWLIFRHESHIDELWVKIKQATENGILGRSSKVATAKPNSNAQENGTKVICVYTYNWTDEEDVMQIRNELRGLGSR